MPLPQPSFPLLPIFSLSGPWLTSQAIHNCPQLHFPGGATGKEPACQCRRGERLRFHPWVGKIPWRGAWPPPAVFLGLPGGADGKGSACNVGDWGSTPGLGRSPGEGSDNPLQYSCLENPMDRGAWRATVQGVTELDTIDQQPFHSFIFSSQGTSLETAKESSGALPKALTMRRAFPQQWLLKTPRLLSRTHTPS